MAEDGYRRRTNLHRNGRYYENPPKRRIGIIGFQVIICMLCIIAAAIIRLAGGNLYLFVRTEVSNALDSQVTNSDVSTVFAVIKSTLPDVSSIFSSSGSSKTSSQAESSDVSSSSS